MRSVLVFLLIFISVVAEAQEYYLVKENKELQASINSQISVLISEYESKCLRIERVGDFNQDGYSDVFIEIVNGCGGNCCGDSYQIFTYDGKIFHPTLAVGYDWDGVEILDSENDFKFNVQTVYEGASNTEMCNNKVETFRLNRHVLELVNTVVDKYITAKPEIRASDFEERENETLYFSYDLDGDKKNDKILCTYWSRWGRIGSWVIKFGNGFEYTGRSSPKRIGVLSTKTNNVNDLILECGDIIKWNGIEYNEPEIGR